MKAEKVLIHFSNLWYCSTIGKVASVVQSLSRRGQPRHVTKLCLPLSIRLIQNSTHPPSFDADRKHANSEPVQQATLARFPSTPSASDQELEMHGCLHTQSITIIASPITRPILKPKCVVNGHPPCSFLVPNDLRNAAYWTSIARL